MRRSGSIYVRVLRMRITHGEVLFFPPWEAVLPEMSSKKNFCHFTRVQDDYLIQLVAAQPVIYDPNHQLYKDLTVKDNVWKEISSSIHKTVEECKIRWRSIRDLYNRKKKEILKNPNSVKAIKWEYMDQLSFLDRTSHRKQKAEEEVENYQDLEKDERNFEEDILLEEFENCEDDCNPIEPEIKIMPKRRKRKLQIYQNDFYDRYGFEKDAVSLFFASMAQTVMTFPPALAAEAKERVCRIITSLEYRAHVKNDQSDASSKDGLSPVHDNP